MRYLILMLILFSWKTKDAKPGDNRIIVFPDGTRMEFIYIPAGTFIMGSSAEEQDRHGDEDPLRNVTISRGFYLGKFEVTQQQWLSVTNSNPSVFQKEENHLQKPVDWVSWQDCQNFIEKLNEYDLGIFRLPTEAEWEYACRAGTNTRYYWGDDYKDNIVYDHAWAFSRAEGKSHEVGKKKPNAWGLYDMSGNVWEWCSDWRGPYNPADTLDPVGPPDGTKKIYRGGSWFNKPSTLRSANRHGHEPDVKGTNAGLRLVLEIAD
ncbi:MAG: formylglycine-generating enzyme family protein [Cyclobacteriaceae bacterium]